MQFNERLIAPGLGVVIVLSAFILGVPVVYKVLVGFLGLVAVGTYFVPYKVQVETRIVIAGLGLIILLIVTSTAFWLTLLSFGGIAALQFQHRGALGRNPATIVWLTGVLQRVQARRSGRTEVGGEADEETGLSSEGGDGKATSDVGALAGTLSGLLRVNAAGVGGVVVGAIVLGSVFTTWIAFFVTVGRELAAFNFTLKAGASELGLPVLNVFFFVILALAVLSIMSIVLPRLVAAIIAAAGFLVTLASYLYVFVEVDRVAGELSSIGVGALPVPAVGAFIAGFAFLVMLVLQAVPKANG